jgi:hypothetical protein
MRSRPIRWGGLLPLIFVLVGFCLAGAGLKHGLKGMRLLRHGVLGRGKLISKKAVAGDVRDARQAYDLTFEFTAANQRTYQVTARTHLTEELEDEAEELLMYDRLCPSDAVMLDDLPASPRIDERGNIFCASPAESLAFLIIPLGTIIWQGIQIYKALVG